MTDNIYQHRLWLVFDVESIGLHGEGFAVGWHCFDEDGVKAEGEIGCLRDRAIGSWDSWNWVKENIPPLDESRETPRHVRQFFWQVWMDWKKEGAWLAADVLWPVEANFLSLARKENGGDFDGPFPFIDIASVRFACGLNPVTPVHRLENELSHSPLGDARQSARLLREVLQKRPI